MAEKAKLGAGNVEIELDGEAKTLKPTLRAARTISRTFGGFQKAIEAIGAMDLEASIAVVMAGVNAKPAEGDEIAEAVFATGLPDLVEPLILYLTNLANGGRPLSGGSEEENPRVA